LCGIVGYTTFDQNIDLRSFIEGCWKDLQYRGHQGFGAAMIPGNSNRIHRIRQPGRLRDADEDYLESFFSGLPSANTYSILAHTRWPTHGGDSERNSHPHLDCTEQIAVVQNGTVINYSSLRDELSPRHNIVSDTDTEIIAHMLEENISDNIHEMVKSVATRLQGDSVFVFTSTYHPDTIVGVKVGVNPLAVAKGPYGNFLISDSEAILGKANEITRLGIEEYAIITPASVELWNLFGERVERDFEPFEWGYDDVDKMGYPTYTEKEIFQQPGVILDCLEANYNVAKRFSEELYRLYPHLHFLACGTSYHATGVAQTWGEILSGRHLPIHSYEMNIPDDIKAILWISQSGRTFELIKIVQEAMRSNSDFYKLGLVNKKHGDLESLSDDVAYTQAGPEIGVASTKAYIGQLVFLYLLMENLANKFRDNEIPPLESHPLRETSRQVQEILDRSYELDSIALILRDYDNIIYMGNGINYWTAREGGLKFEELAETQVKQINGMELKHGPLSSVDENTVIVAVAPKDQWHSSIMNNIREARSVGDGTGRPLIISIGTERDKELRELSDYLFEVPEGNENLYPLTTIVPLQLLALKFAELKSCDIDQPRNIAKTITV